MHSMIQNPSQAKIKTTTRVVHILAALSEADTKKYEALSEYMRNTSIHE